MVDARPFPQFWMKMLVTSACQGDRGPSWDGKAAGDKGLWPQQHPSAGRGARGASSGLCIRAQDEQDTGCALEGLTLERGKSPACRLAPRLKAVVWSPGGLLACLVCPFSTSAITGSPLRGDTDHPSRPPSAAPEGEVGWVTPPPLLSRSPGHSVLPESSGASLLAFPVVQLQSAVGTRRGLYSGCWFFYLVLECFNFIFQRNLHLFIHVCGSTTHARGTEFENTCLPHLQASQLSSPEVTALTCSLQILPEIILF